METVDTKGHYLLAQFPSKVRWLNRYPNGVETSCVWAEDGDNGRAVLMEGIAAVLIIAVAVVVAAMDG